MKQGTHLDGRSSSHTSRRRGSASCLRCSWHPCDTCANTVDLFPPLLRDYVDTECHWRRYLDSSRTLHVLLPQSVVHERQVIISHHDTRAVLDHMHRI